MDPMLSEVQCEENYPDGYAVFNWDVYDAYRAKWKKPEPEPEPEPEQHEFDVYA